MKVRNEKPKDWNIKKTENKIQQPYQMASVALKRNYSVIRSTEIGICYMLRGVNLTDTSVNWIFCFFLSTVTFDKAN